MSLRKLSRPAPKPDWIPEGHPLKRGADAPLFYYLTSSLMHEYIACARLLTPEPGRGLLSNLWVFNHHSKAFAETLVTAFGVL